MDEEVKNLLQEMGDAISEALSSSSRIAEITEKMKLSGYGVQLYSETRFWLTRCESGTEDTSVGGVFIQ